MKNKKILWLSRHTPFQLQIELLRKAFGPDTQVEQDSRPFSSAEEIVKRYRDGAYDDMVVVAPLSVIARLVDLGLRPLWSEMSVVDRAKADLSYRGRNYRFDGFRRIKMVRLEFENSWFSQRE